MFEGWIQLDTLKPVIVKRLALFKMSRAIDNLSTQSLSPTLALNGIVTSNIVMLIDPVLETYTDALNEYLNKNFALVFHLIMIEYSIIQFKPLCLGYIGKESYLHNER